MPTFIRQETAYKAKKITRSKNRLIVEMKDKTIKYYPNTFYNQRIIYSAGKLIY